MSALSDLLDIVAPKIAPSPVAVVPDLPPPRADDRLADKLATVACLDELHGFETAPECGYRPPFSPDEQELIDARRAELEHLARIGGQREPL